MKNARETITYYPSGGTLIELRNERGLLEGNPTEGPVQIEIHPDGSRREIYNGGPSLRFKYAGIVFDQIDVRRDSEGFTVSVECFVNKVPPEVVHDNMEGVVMPFDLTPLWDSISPEMQVGIKLIPSALTPRSIGTIMASPVRPLVTFGRRVIASIGHVKKT